MRQLADTDIIIDGLNNRPGALERLERLAESGLAVSIISVGELYEGAYRDPDPESRLAGMRQFLQGYQKLGLTDATMEEFARVRASLRSQGQLIPDLDLLIAATALTHGLTLVTRNLRHFARINGLQLASFDDGT
jgi:predicted nucleic acid-binding protein